MISVFGLLLKSNLENAASAEEVNCGFIMDLSQK
jgi:hypothetical protein